MIIKRIGHIMMLALPLLVGVPSLVSLANATTQEYRTYVEPTPDETMDRPCEYELTLRDASKPVKAIFVVVERGWQVGNLYFDSDVTAFAEQHDLALLLARHCRAKTEQDMDIIPEHGVGRALLQATKQLAEQSHHAELANSRLILFSFSGGGSMVGRMVAYAPERILAAIEYAPGHREPIGIDTVTLPEKALSVPQFVIANGADNICGTQRPYVYFERYHKIAPMTFMVQNGVPHCCVMNVIHIALLWLEDVLNVVPRNPAALIDEGNSWRGYIRSSESGVKDDWKEPVWNVTQAWVTPPHAKAPPSSQDAGWMPSRRFAEAWLAFENQRTHPITPLE